MTGSIGKDFAFKQGCGLAAGCKTAGIGVRLRERNAVITFHPVTWGQRSSEQQLQALLDALEAEQLLSDQRFAAGVARVRGARFGSQRVANELRQKGVGAEVAGLVADLKAGDLDLAHAVWARKFGAAPLDAAERARQMRFLQTRGFPGDVIRKVVPKAGTETED